MSALTKAMSPWEHELSQMLGKSTHLIAAPETAWSTLAMIGKVVDTIESAIVGTLDDPLAVKTELDIETKLWAWRTENEWLFYELTEAGWAA